MAFVDHSGEPGGGQLGLLRYLRQTNSIQGHVIQLGPGAVFDELTDRGLTVRKLSRSTSVLAHHMLNRPIAHAITDCAPDLVVANSTRAISVLAANPLTWNGTSVAHLRDDLNPLRNSFAKRVYMSRFALPRFDGLIANSAWTLSTVPKRVLESRPSQIAHPVSGTSSVSATEWQRSPGPVRLLSLSRLDRWKGIDVLLDALRNLEAEGLQGRFELTIAGSTTHGRAEYLEELRAKASMLKSRVEFVGHVSDPSGLLDSADVLVCASTTPEPFGQVVVQGLSAGLVVVATNRGGPAEILEGGAGVLVEPDDAQALAGGLRELVTDLDRLVDFRGTALERATSFADERTVAMMDSALLKIATEAVR